jgi:hypothetical protein
MALELNAIWPFSSALNIEYDLNHHLIKESRGINTCQDLLHIFAGSFESNFGETREDRTSLVVECWAGQLRMRWLDWEL